MAQSAARSDVELLAAHVAGDRTAFAEFFARHGPSALRLATSQSATPQDAADAVQEAMLAVHRGAASFRKSAAVSTWLYRIVTNACADQHRRRGRYRFEALDETVLPTVEWTDATDTAVVLRAAVAALPLSQRTALFAVDIVGLSLPAAADSLGVPVGTLKSRRARARAQLQRQLTH